MGFEAKAEEKKTRAANWTSVNEGTKRHEHMIIDADPEVFRYDTNPTGSAEAR
jgi:hypothetical protein